MDEQGVTLESTGGVSHHFTELVLDYTGTLALDGELLPGVTERLTDLARFFRITVLTADTFGSARAQLEVLPADVHIVRTGTDKADFVRELGAEQVIAIGNGRNDIPMMRLAGLRIGIIGPEGAVGELFGGVDVVVADIRQALDLVRNPLRLKATLRE